MGPRRTWLKQGAADDDGGTAVVGGEPITAAPAAEPIEFEMLSHIFMTDPDWRRDGGHHHVIASFSFGADGSFCLTPQYFGEDRELSYGPPIVGAAGMSVREFVDLLMTVPKTNRPALAVIPGGLPEKAKRRGATRRRGDGPGD